MGLLRRAAVAAGSGEKEVRAPVAARAEKKQPKSPGLLHRSIKVLQPPRAAPEKPLSIELARAPARAAQEKATGGRAAAGGIQAAARGSVRAATIAGVHTATADTQAEVLAAIDSLSGGVELPSRLFTAITTLLGIAKGAFLLYDPVRLVYAPWAVRGYDQTTLHRMRIPLGANESWNALANGGPLIFTTAASIAPFQQYFSAREFSSVGKLILVPFIAEAKLIAVLLVTDASSPFATDEELVSCLARVAEAGAPRVYRAREARIAAAGPTGPRPGAASVRDEPSRLLAFIEGSGKKATLVSLSLEELSRNILASHENLDPFRLHEDLTYFLGSFVADVGRALSVRQGRFIVALPEYDPAGLDLFVHQLSLYLHGLFSGNAEPESRVVPRVLKSVSWPADGADLKKLLKSLSS